MEPLRRSFLWLFSLGFQFPPSRHHTPAATDNDARTISTLDRERQVAPISVLSPVCDADHGKLFRFTLFLAGTIFLQFFVKGARLDRKSTRLNSSHLGIS